MSVISLPGIEEKVAFLRRPESYPVATDRVETKETHMSWVFLTEAWAWKLKKPVRYDYLDFSTVEARRRNSEEEVRINRVLAPDVYLGTVPLTADSLGNMQLGGKGVTIDWLVRMRRLPDARTLDRAIADGTVSTADARKIGALLAGFYRQAPRVSIKRREYRGRLSAELRADHMELAKGEYGLAPELLETIAAAQVRFLKKRAELFDDRVQTGKIIEAHGDLRPEHIWLEGEPVITDRLEFNRDFRILDVASELAFLALECDRLGAPEVGRVILETCWAETGDPPPAPLLVFYQSFHASLRAKIALWHLRDREIADPAKWVSKALDYLHLAERITNVS